jgi:hypothetical protein
MWCVRFSQVGRQCLRRRAPALLESVSRTVGWQVAPLMAATASRTAESPLGGTASDATVSSVGDTPGQFKVPNVAECARVLRDLAVLQSHLQSVGAVADDTERRAHMRILMYTAYTLKSPLLRTVFEAYRGVARLKPMSSDYTLLLQASLHVTRSWPDAQQSIAQAQRDLSPEELQADPRLWNSMLAVVSSLAKDSVAVVCVCMCVYLVDDVAVLCMYNVSRPRPFALWFTGANLRCHDEL